MSSSAQLLIDVFEKLQSVQESNLDLTILIRATCDAVREKFPDLPYQKHFDLVTKSASIKKMRQQHQTARASIAAAKKQLLGEPKPD